MCQSILVENLVRVLQNSVDDLDLPSSVCNRRTGIRSHECRTEDNGEVVGVHAIDMRVLNNTVQME